MGIAESVAAPCGKLEGNTNYSRSPTATISTPIAMKRRTSPRRCIIPMVNPMMCKSVMKRERSNPNCLGPLLQAEFAANGRSLGNRDPTRLDSTMQSTQSQTSSKAIPTACKPSRKMKAISKKRNVPTIKIITSNSRTRPMKEWRN